MRVLFLYPNLRGMNMLPPSIAMFSTLLKQHGVQVDLFDTTHWRIPGEDDFDSDKAKERNLNVRPFDFAEHRVTIHETDVYDDFEKKVQSFAPDLIAVSATEDIFPVAIPLLKRVRRFGIPTILGGVFASFAPELALSFDEIDMVCVGEGENCLVDLCRRMSQGLNYDNVTNLWIKKRDGRIVKNMITDPVDLAETVLPDVGIFEESRLYRPMAGKIYRMLPVETHRGCPYTCAFCNSPSQETFYEEATGQKFFRIKPFHKVREELEYYRDAWGAEYFYFWADTFIAYSAKQFDEFCEMYSDIKIPFWIQTRSETLTEARLKKLKDVGLHRMALGIEHGNEKFRREIVDRRMTNESILRSMKIPNQVGIPFSVNNIIGFPTETYELAWDTIKLNRQITADNYNCYSFSPFHGTPLRKMAERLSYIAPNQITRSLTRDSILDMPQFTRTQVEGLRRCFVMYVKFPESRWPEIKKAESMTPEGDTAWDRLRVEFMATFFTPDEGDLALETA
jgi:radical SAM superfamily enzyme YgiQ (UPF0313 family)